jgi:hypothetical protein
MVLALLWIHWSTSYHTRTISTWREQLRSAIYPSIANHSKSLASLNKYESAAIPNNIIMFSWSAKPKRGSGSDSHTQTGSYPGNRSQSQSQSSNSNSYSHAPTIQGSIRGPSSFTRAQHLEAYLNDETLKRSTRRVSAGMITFYLFCF